MIELDELDKRILGLVGEYGERGEKINSKMLEHTIYDKKSTKISRRVSRLRRNGYLIGRSETEGHGRSIYLSVPDPKNEMDVRQMFSTMIGMLNVLMKRTDKFANALIKIMKIIENGPK